MFLYGHGSWVVVVIFVGMFAVRALTSQRRRGRYGGSPGPGRPFTGSHPPGPPGGPIAGPPDLSGATSSGTAPGWFTDPYFKHTQRYWSGTEWTEHVTDDGVPGTDPPPANSGRHDGG
jgi:hypothetical protein